MELREKIGLFEDLILECEALISKENWLISDYANVVAAIQGKFKFWWTGFYLVENNRLVLGPFQGPVACTQIAFGKGVCGHTWKQQSTTIVPDVHLFPGHIACSAVSQSEIVVPVFDSKQNVVAVLDIDSEHLNHFDEVDQKYLEQICSFITKIHFS